ncbi:aminodeoxychorismate synthase component I [Tranquillimonas alkanivorans]|uniref:Aminodeoxychorismate synthase, subunit I n=1 Tax=Tranquillimonas alkanivorans TaxID=441119 RepID=A0A1I5M587_9RHOB|nr:aminodeoxychorismate synthase component I [Tranquillimonas alkanivorans]SFP04096.1 aminodeoxychorismate synthase, subunit I [Tranquillimonas alkanivorans]
MTSGRIIFDAGPLPGGTLFERPRRIVRADTPAEVPAALSDLDAARRDGLWVAGYASYELGYCFTGKLGPLMPAKRTLPLMLFGVFDGPDALPALPTDPDARLSQPQPLWSADDYRAAFGRVHDYIAAGDTYQVNLTFPMHSRWQGDPLDLYAALRRRQPVPHGAFVDLGGPALLSRSPELFFRTGADGVIETRPMKGTVARGATEAEDAERRAWLGVSAKNRAENLMIVDLLRNDISRVAETGSVEVPELFRIEAYSTVFQMTSLVRARLRRNAQLSDILRALHPCGSVTGAPKVRAMEIIHELEPAPREAYCGAIGWAAPDGRASFNVGIRTLMLMADGEARLDVGGGVVYDSTADAEYEEALWKSRFADLSRPA